MARTFTLTQIMTRCRQRSDMENSTLISDTELKGMISSVYAELYSILVSSGMRYFEFEQEITTVATGYAAGTMVCVAKASLLDGETFTLHDGYGQLTFEFDVDGSGVLVAGNTQINVSADTTVTQVGARVQTAINAATHADGTAFRITALNSSGTVALTNDGTGAIGNQKSYESVANTGFSLTDMTAGGGSYILRPDYLSTVGVDYVVSSATGQRWELQEYMVQERNAYSGTSGSYACYYAIKGPTIEFYPTPPAGQVYKHIYVPQPQDLSLAPTSTNIDVVTPDGENFLTWGVAILALAKEESDTGPAFRERERARARVEEWACLRALNAPRRPTVADGTVYRDPGEYWPR